MQTTGERECSLVTRILVYANFAMNQLRSEVLACYRSLHRTRKQVFKGDTYALQVAAEKIREEFRKNISEQNPEKIKEFLIIGQDVDKIMRHSVLQLQLNERGNYELKITKDTILPDNAPYKTTTQEDKTTSGAMDKPCNPSCYQKCTCVE